MNSSNRFNIGLRLILSAVTSAVVCVLTGFLWNNLVLSFVISIGIHKSINTVFFVPFIEEIIKVLILYAVLMRKVKLSRPKRMMYAFISGILFGFIENIFYLMIIPETDMQRVIFVRFFMTAVMHGLALSASAYYISDGILTIGNWVYGILSAVFFHSVWNYETLVRGSLLFAYLLITSYVIIFLLFDFRLFQKRNSS